MKFLCGGHSQQLKRNPNQAIRACQHSYENGLSLLALGQPNDALPHLGCAFESAEIVLSANVIDVTEGAAIFASCSASLARLLINSGNNNQGQTIINLAESRLLSLLSQSPEYSGVILQQIITMKYFVGCFEAQQYPMQLQWLGKKLASEASEFIH